MKDNQFLIEIKNSDILARGAIIRRINQDKDQQGVFIKYDEEDNLVLQNIVDLAEEAYFADNGILKINKDDKIYRYQYTFNDSPVRSNALALVSSWSLYKKSPELQNDIIKFVKSVYSPEQILDLKEKDNLSKLFIPIQQKFKTGKYTRKIDWRQVGIDKFRAQLESLETGDHLTYIASIPDSSSQEPMFYSSGTSPHRETHQALSLENFSFNPTNGGHIKLQSRKNNIKTFIVDSGSNYLGQGVKTKLAVAERVAGALYKVYQGYYFIPAEGRGAFGSEQSY